MISGNTIFITGGATGIGLALAKQLLPQNQVIICGRNTDRLAEAKRACPQLTTYHCDLTNPASRSQVVEQLLHLHPQLNMLINNAGVQHNYQFTEGGNHAGQIREEISTNLLAPIQLTALLLPQLMAQPEAAIVNITSALAIAPKQNAAVYSATKAALRSFTRTLRYQLEGTRVKVFEVVPSLVATAMTDGRGQGKISPEQLASETLQAIFRGRQEILIGKTRLLYALHRLFPGIAYRLLRSA